MTSKDMTFELKLNTSSEEVWNSWLEPKKLVSWLTQKAQVEPKIGGAYELFWDPSTPTDNSTIDCKILAIVPNRFLSFEWRGPVPYADIMNIKPFPTWVALSFEQVAVNQTIVHFRHAGWGDSDKWNEAYKWQANAWKMAGQRMENGIQPTRETIQ